MAKLFFMCSGRGEVVASINPLPRMGQDQPAREKMQLGFEPRRNGAQRIATSRIVRGLSIVFRVADDRMTDLFAMGAQLVGAAGDRAHRQPGRGAA